MKGFLAASLWPLLTSASPMVVDTIHNGVAPLLSSTQSQEIPDSYMVVFKKHVPQSSASSHHSWVQDLHVQAAKSKRDMSKRSLFPMSDFEGLKHTFDIPGQLLGYSGHFDEDVVEQIRKHPDVSRSATAYHLQCELTVGSSRLIMSRKILS